MIYCDIVDCNEQAVLEDDMEHPICEVHYEQCLNEGSTPEDFKPLFTPKEDK